MAKKPVQQNFPGTTHPELEKANSTEPEIKPDVFNFSDVMKDPDFINSMLENLNEVIASLNDIPAQIEQHSRITLAKSFIYQNPQRNGFDFDQAGFERAWAALTEPEAEENPSETV